MSDSKGQGAELPSDGADNQAAPRRQNRGRSAQEAAVDLLPADPERVLRALERGAELARSGATELPILLVRPVDLEGLGARELRPALDEMLCERHADAALDSLLDTGVLEALFPEVHAMVGFGDGEFRHKDVWKHTKQVVIQALPRLELRWSALLHDIGKVKTRAFGPDGEVTFHGHAEVGARMFERMERRMKLFASDAPLREEIHFLVLHHLRASCYDGSWTDSAVRRFAREMGPYLEDLLALSRADMTTKRQEKRRRAMEQLKQLSERIAQLALEDARVPPLPKGLGNLLVEEFSLPPTKLRGDIMRALEAACEAGELLSGQDGDYYVQAVARDRARFGLG